MKPSTAACVTRVTSSSEPVVGTIIIPVPSAAQTSATPAKKDTAPGSSKA
jgi:hypothetical protein